MKKDKIYFASVPGYGDLYLEEILFEDECPMLFILRSKNENLRFVCVCCDFRKEQRWIITPIEIPDIIALLKDKITIRDAFTHLNSKEYIVGVWKNGYSDVEYKTCAFEQVPESDLPTADVYLEADGEFEEYITRLQRIKKIIVGNSDCFIKKDWSYMQYETKCRFFENILTSAKTIYGYEAQYNENSALRSLPKNTEVKSKKFQFQFVLPINKFYGENSNEAKFCSI